MSRDAPSPTGLDPRWGILGIVFYVVHGAALLATNQPGNLLWSCHLASLLVAGGILARKPRMVGVALGWLVLGLPAWFGALSGGMGFLPTSTLTHVGSLALALFSVRKTGIPRGTWLRATAALAILWVVTRIALPPGQNVNLSRTYWFGWEGRILPYPVYLVDMLGLSAAVFLATEKAVHRLFSRRRSPDGV